MSNYLIELSIIHLVLYSAYWIFFRNETQFGKMRLFLLGAFAASLTIPLLKLPKLFQSETTPEFVAGPMEAVMLEEMTFTPQHAEGFDFSILALLYATIAMYFLVRFILAVGKILKLEKESSYENFFHTRIRRSSKVKGSFTFFNWIFLSDEVQPDQKEYDVILRHEKAHASLGHTYDLMFFELFKVAFWWLPTVWLAIKEIKKIHEYQADAYALKSYSLDRYSSILISSTLKANGLSLASSFHDGLIFKRLKAMKQKAKNVSPWKIGTVTLLTALLFVAFACSEEMEANIKEMGEASNSIAFEQLPAEMQADLRDIQDNLTFIKVEVPDGTSKAKIGEIEALNELDPSTIHSMNVVKNDEFQGIYIALKKEGANFNYFAEKSQLEGDVFTVVENQPEFPGGKDALIQYLINEIRYPEAAKKAGLEGRVMVQFTVDKEGSISQVEAIKGIGNGCDKEAVRVISAMPDWKPGTQRGKKVAVRMVLPIVFKMSDHSDEKSGNIWIDEAKSDFNQMKINADFTNGTWSGTVLNAETGKALPGVNVIEEGTTHGTVTDLDGTFKLKPREKSNHLVLSYVGFKSAKLESAK